MGISRGAISLLAATLRSAERGGTVLTFGVQKIEATHEDATTRLAAAGIAPAPLPRQAGRLRQETLFRLLGFDAVESLDHYDAEKPTHVHNLNAPIPDSLRGRFALVYDGGTTEHCFSPPQVFGNILLLLKVGGRVIHHLPMNNQVDHGFYQFSPTLLFDFYEANGFDDLQMRLHFGVRGRESYVSYDPRKDGSLPYDLGGKANVLLYFSARKQRANGELVEPIQGRYRRTFGGETKAAKAQGLARLKQSIHKRTFRLRAKPL
jgi:SAM-dependent methyltransferase